jgi:SagB-type dehydrogenase family enzyme
MVNGIGKEFIERTKYQYLDDSDQKKGLPQPPLELEYDGTKTVTDLPKPSEIQVSGVSLREAIENRRSIRKYSEEPLTLEELSYLLWCTQGVKEVTARPVTLRTVPSAGARHAFETYLLVNRVEDLQRGLYRFLAIEHKLVEMDAGSDIADKVAEACPRQKFVKTSAVTFIWTAVAYRMKWRHGERGYRFLHLDAGHVCQNLYLSAEAIDCGVCAVGVFSDDDLNRLLDVDGENQFVIYIATVGKK